MKHESPEITHKYCIPAKNSYQRVCLNQCSKRCILWETNKRKNTTK